MVSYIDSVRRLRTGYQSVLLQHFTQNLDKYTIRWNEGLDHNAWSIGHDRTLGMNLEQFLAWAASEEGTKAVLAAHTDPDASSISNPPTQEELTIDFLRLNGINVPGAAEEAGSGSASAAGQQAGLQLSDGGSLQKLAEREVLMPQEVYRDHVLYHKSPSRATHDFLQAMANDARVSHRANHEKDYVAHLVAQHFLSHYSTFFRNSPLQSDGVIDKREFRKHVKEMMLQTYEWEKVHVAEDDAGLESRSIQVADILWAKMNYGGISDNMHNKGGLTLAEIAEWDRNNVVGTEVMKRTGFEWQHNHLHAPDLQRDVVNPLKGLAQNALASMGAAEHTLTNDQKAAGDLFKWEYYSEASRGGCWGG